VAGRQLTFRDRRDIELDVCSVFVGVVEGVGRGPRRGLHLESMVARDLNSKIT